MSSTPSNTLRLAVLALLALGAMSGCATYSDNVQEAKIDVAQSRPEEAAILINEELQAESIERLPTTYDKDNPLLLLERATALQAMGEYELAARDMISADNNLEWLDVSTAGRVEIAKYMYSQSAQKYRAPAYERLLLNSLNMLNFLSLGDLEGARVEARRFTILEQYFLDEEETSLLSGVLGFGNYLSGAAFEAVGDHEQAARYYCRAWHYGLQSDEFYERLADLLAVTSYKPRDLLQDDEKALEKVRAEAETRSDLSLDDYRKRHRHGDTLIVVQSGMAPWREAKRVPIAQALDHTQGSRHHRFEGDERRKVQDMANRGVIDSVNFPMLTRRGNPPPRSVDVAVDDQRIDTGPRIDVSSQVEKAYAHILPSLMVSAITRLMTRTAAGKATQGAVKAGGGDSGAAALARLGVQGAMSLADKPDTRSWITLPGNIHLARVQLEPGKHTIATRVGGRVDEETVEIRADGINVVNFSRLR